ncbi:hypothetical protein [Tenacibaculum piscium]|uniref:Uncharacterized protein n=1 Tax=Tenacibaculum piscium TaxID=1458515 RepID=A0A2H1YH26_9FLAO|nr:hypothetical protein [Tenacibaculum piscium]MBE7630150.1 hypothetical protein [Tenacibaculum piscium]MBE7671080.1 hypothetical protein [Tenacibaculum piscium]SOS74822.1 conserved hypothetical protein [Tenacibaculum piscium]
MNTFKNIKEILTTLYREEKLLSEMFSKRKLLHYKKSYALDIVDDDESKINSLLELSVLRENDNCLEIDDVFLDFFEKILEVNEEINVSFIDENITEIKERIIYYLEVKNEKQKNNHLKFIKKTFRKIGNITLRNVIDIRRNIENTFKNEPNYKVKKLKLKSLDEKRNAIKKLIDKTLSLINTEELTFFEQAKDEELNQILIDLKYNLSDCAHNLIAIQKQIINFLNQIKNQGEFLEKLRKVKYLKDQFRIKSETDIAKILSLKNDVIFEKRIAEPLNLSIDFLRDDENAFTIIKKIALKNLDKIHYKPLIADSISDEYLENSIEQEVMINLEEIRNEFVGTSDNLFNFILNYDFSKKVDFNERVTIFCQVASQFELELKFENEYQQNNGIEYALIYPK